MKNVNSSFESFIQLQKNVCDFADFYQDFRNLQQQLPTTPQGVLPGGFNYQPDPQGVPPGV